MIRRFLAASVGGLLASAGCIDNANMVGSLKGMGGDHPILVGGASGAGGGGGGPLGGTGSGPGMGLGGATGGGASTTATCRANGQQLVLAKACETADDCALIQDSGAISLPGVAMGSCSRLVVGINAADEAGFNAFSASCPPPVGCGLGQAQLQTEDGQLVPIDTVLSVECAATTCRSYVP